MEQLRSNATSKSVFSSAVADRDSKTCSTGLLDQGPMRSAVRRTKSIKFDLAVVTLAAPSMIARPPWTWRGSTPPSVSS